MKIQEQIEKEIGMSLDGFPQADYDRIETALEMWGEAEIWIVQGMGRKHIVPSEAGKHESSFPIQNYLCNISAPNNKSK